MEKVELGKSEYLYKEIAKKIETECNKVYIITPEQFSFTAENKLLEALKEDAVLKAEVLTFHRMAYRVMQEVGGVKDTVLSSVGKSMLVDSIIRKQKGKLKFLGNSDENIKVVENAITELKKHCISEEKLKNTIPNIEDRYLQEKLNDIYSIYESYQKQLREGYIDENDTLDRLVQNIEASNLFNDTLIYIDEFAGFTMQEYRIIEKLLLIAKKVTITITTDSIKEEQIESDIFFYNKQTANKLLKMADNLNIQVEKNVKLDKVYRFHNLELQHLENNLYATSYKKYEKNVDNISLFLAKNPYSEVEQIGKEIIRLVKEKNYRYKDITVITKDIETYSGLVKSIFNEYQIPVFIDEKRDLSQNIFVKYILTILNIFAKNWTYESVIDYVKTGFLDIDNEDIYLFENTTLMLGIKHKKWYQGEWNFGQVTESKKEEVEKIKNIRELVINPLIRLKETINKSKTYEDISKELYSYFISNGIQEKLTKKAEELEKIGELELSKLYETTWNTVMQILEEIVMLFGKQKVTFDEYISIFKTGLKASSLGKIPATQDVVLLGDVERSKSHKVKTVFILGVNDGVFPSIRKEEGFLGDEDRKILKNKGIELAKGTLEQLYEESFNIYRTFTIAEEKIRGIISIVR